VIASGAGCDRTQFEAAATELRDRFFFVWLDSEPEHACRIETVRLGGAERAVWSAEEKGTLADFVLREATPLVAPFHKTVHAASKRPVVYLFHESEVPAPEDLVQLQAASRRQRERGSNVMFAHLPVSVWDGLRAGAVLPYPSLVLVDTAKLNHHYAYSGNALCFLFFYFVYILSREVAGRGCVELGGSFFERFAESHDSEREGGGRNCVGRGDDANGGQLV
jgi:hypothetical protein